MFYCIIWLTCFSAIIKLTRWLHSLTVQSNDDVTNRCEKSICKIIQWLIIIYYSIACSCHDSHDLMFCTVVMHGCKKFISISHRNIGIKNSYCNSLLSVHRATNQNRLNIKYTYLSKCWMCVNTGDRSLMSLCSKLSRSSLKRVNNSGFAEKRIYLVKNRFNESKFSKGC